MAHPGARQVEELIEHLRVAPGTTVTLAQDHDPAYTAGWARKKQAAEHLERSVELLAEYQSRLAAQASSGLLVVLQGIDASGKDGTIRHVMSGVNPQGVVVHKLQGPLRRGAQPRLSVALLPSPARAGADRCRPRGRGSSQNATGRPSASAGASE